jgi:hypothetical protein
MRVVPPNTCQFPYVIIDRLMPVLSNYEYRCLTLIARKTTGWGKLADAISISQFLSGTGTDRVKTIHSALKGLEEKGYISSEKKKGMITIYRLSSLFFNGDNGGQLVAQSAASLSTGSGGKRPKSSGGKCPKSSGGKRHPTIDNLQNLNTKETACDRFIEKYPLRVEEFEIRSSWDVLNESHNLNDSIEVILADIKNRMQNDRKWINGYILSPLKYLRGKRWEDQVVTRVAEKIKAHSGEPRLPRSDSALPDFAKSNGLPAPWPGEEYPQYRLRLQRSIDDRDRRAV